MCFGDAWVRKHDLSSLRVLGSVGESINPEAWRWFHDVVGDGTCPITDTWWQTETGMFQITTVPSMPLKPGAVGVRSLARRLLLSTRRAMSSLQAKRASSSSKTRGRP